ncbi:hypothetical protein HPP92_009190 [Vanilla planifolia]|uniref:MLO-like protein n=1 Tax=Vanilla planifolia TaxID=51239 RepID=A0A835V6Q3_VANPL|nr:hypothetical protein HPP92_009190 [Vanilla planifolia]
MAGGGGSEEEEGLQLYRTPTWIVAVVCTVIVCISLFFERFLHRLGKGRSKRSASPRVSPVTYGPARAKTLPPRGAVKNQVAPLTTSSAAVAADCLPPVDPAVSTVQKRFVNGSAGKNPFIKKLLENVSVSPMITHVHEADFIREHYRGIGKDSRILSWLAHCRGNPKFDFHKYMVRALEADFKKVVGLSWYLWIFVVVFLFLNVGGWHAYFWLSLVPLMLLFAVGSKLEHIIVQLAHEVAEKHSAIEGDLVVRPSDDHFWFHRPRIMLLFIHLILFHVAFEFAYFFWILATYGYNSCIMDATKYIIPRLIICLVVQVICSYSTLPLYAIVTQMGSSFKPVIFEDHVQAGLVGWAQTVKKKGKKLTTALSRRPKEEPQLECVFSIKNREMEQFGPEIVELNDSNINHGA